MNIGAEIVVQCDGSQHKIQSSVLLLLQKHNQSSAGLKVRVEGYLKGKKLIFNLSGAGK